MLKRKAGLLKNPGNMKEKDLENNLREIPGKRITTAFPIFSASAYFNNLKEDKTLGKRR